MNVQQSIDLWGQQKFAAAGKPVPDGTHITLAEELPSSSFCETCGPDPVNVTISGGGQSLVVYMSVGDIIQEILAAEQAAS